MTRSCSRIKASLMMYSETILMQEVAEKNKLLKREERKEKKEKKVMVSQR